MTTQDLEVQEKKEHEAKGEKTQVGQYYSPHTDIHESSDALIITMDMPGVEKKNVDILLEQNVLTITGNVDFTNYEGLKPIYSEYNVGNYSRSFSLSSEIDQDRISAKIENGVLELALPKIKEAVTKKIEVQ